MKICVVCGGVGFPVGTASAERVLLMGKALTAVGVPVHVLHLGPSAISGNTCRTGTIDGVTWRYLSPTVRRPRNRGLRAACYLWGAFLLPLALARLGRDARVYLFYQGNVLNLWGLTLCGLFRIPAAQECCEWWPGTGARVDGRFTSWMYDRIMFRWSAGALPISRLIAHRISKVTRPWYPQLRVPVLVDAEGVRAVYGQAPFTRGTGQSYFFWCGMVDGYMRDPLLLMAAFGRLAATGQLPRLVLCGPCSGSARRDLTEAAAAEGLEPQALIVAGFVPDAELYRLATNAVGLILPMWDDDRSRTRFPTKLGLYAAAGRPVVTCPIGEIPHYLEDNVNALFFAPGDADGLAARLRRLLDEPGLTERLGTAIRDSVSPHFDYRAHGPRLAAWYQSLRV